MGRVCDHRARHRRCPGAARPGGRILHQAPRIPELRAHADPGAPVGTMDPDRRFGFRPSAPVGHRTSDRDQRRRRARAVPRRERHRGDARARLRIPELCRAAARAAVESGDVHAASGPHAAGGRLRPNRRVRRTQREGARHAGAGHPRHAGSAPRGRRDARSGRAPRPASPGGFRVAARAAERRDPRDAVARRARGDEARCVSRQHVARTGRRRWRRWSTRCVPVISRVRISTVFETEPLPADSPLWAIPNVLITPHSSDNIHGWPRRFAALFADSLERWRAGEPLLNPVTP